MEILWKQRNALNWCLLAYLLLTMLRSRLPAEWHEKGNIILAVVAVGLWAWIAVVATWSYQHAEGEVLPYDRLSTGDYMRWFFGMWAGWHPLATESTVGFLIASAVALPTALVAVCIIGVELYRSRSSTMARKDSVLGIGMAAFVYFLGCWELNALRIHYGVPIPGHFLESPSYDLECDAKAARLDKDYEQTGPEIPVRATVHVSWHREEESAGEDRFGQEHSRSYDVCCFKIKSLRFANGRALPIDFQHDEVEDLSDRFYLDDAGGNVWRVSVAKPKN